MIRKFRKFRKFRRRLLRAFRHALWPFAVALPIALASCAAFPISVEDCRCARLCSERFSPESVAQAIGRTPSTLSCRCWRPRTPGEAGKVERALGVPEFATLTERSRSGLPFAIDPRECAPFRSIAAPLPPETAPRPPTVAPPVVVRP